MILFVLNVHVYGNTCVVMVFAVRKSDIFGRQKINSFSMRGTLTSVGSKFSGNKNREE